MTLTEKKIGLKFMQDSIPDKKNTYTIYSRQNIKAEHNEVESDVINMHNITITSIVIF